MDGTRCPSCGTEVGVSAKFCSECGTPLHRAAKAAEYKQVTVLFADVVHSMDIAAATGPERLREIMAELVDCASSVVKRYGGTVDKFTGDGLMAVFGAPLALEDHALRACMAALGIREVAQTVAMGVKRRDGVDLQLRIGLNSGRVIAGEIGSGALGYTAIGEHVGMAQRMESAAPPSGIMLSASTARLVAATARLGEPELVHIKGGDEPVPARRLLAVGQLDHAGTRAESSLVGRRWEMSAVEGLLDRAINGHGSVVGVVGPPGIGKSRLTRELAVLARRRNVDVFTTFCESHTSLVPFHVVARLLRSATGVEGVDPPTARALIESRAFSEADADDVALFQDLLGIADPNADAPRIDPDARRRRLTALVNAATLANTAPAVYVIEDAHWIDESSESLLADFLTVVPQTRLLTVITYRPEYHGTLARVPGAQTFALAPLSDAETATLVSDLLGPDPSVHELCQAIVERAAGTPYFAEELVLELAERGVLRGNRGGYLSTAEAEVTVPATLQATIASRIDRLEPKAKQALGAAAVIGMRFGTALLAKLGVDPAVDGLLSAQLIDQVTFTGEAEYVFHHPLIRAVAYEAQLKSNRAELHRRIAAAIEQRRPGAPDENAALIAEHLEAAGDIRGAFDWHMRAGAWSANRDIAAAGLNWERARQLADALSGDEPDRTAMRIAPRTMLCANAWRVRAHDADDLFDELRTLCRLTGDKTSLAIAITGPMAVSRQGGDMRRAQRLAAEQLALLDAIGDSSLTAQAAYPALGVKAGVGEMAAVSRWANATIDWADNDPTKGSLLLGSILAVALSLRGLSRSWFGRPGWRDDLDRAVVLAERSADPMTLAMTMSWKIGWGSWDGLIRADDSAVNSTADALRIVEASCDDHAVIMVKWLLASVILRRGAETDRRRGVDLMYQLRETFIGQRIFSGELPVLEAYRGRELAREGNRDEALRVIRKAVGDMMDRGLYGYCIPAIGILVETLQDGGNDDDMAEAEALITTLEAVPVEGSASRDIWSLRVRAMLARAHGDLAGYLELRDRYREMATSLGFEGHMQWAADMP